MSAADPAWCGVAACRLMPTRSCPRSFGALGCSPARPCARMESDDEAPWLADLARDRPKACGRADRHGPHAWFEPGEPGQALRWRCAGVPAVVLHVDDHARVETLRCASRPPAGAWCSRMAAFEGPADGLVLQRLADIGWRCVEWQAGSWSGERVWLCPGCATGEPAAGVGRAGPGRWPA